MVCFKVAWNLFKAGFSVRFSVGSGFMRVLLKVYFKVILEFI